MAGGKIYELGGAEVTSFREIIEDILEITCREKRMVALPFFVASLIGKIAGLVPFVTPPITADQVILLKSDNVVSKEAIAEGRTLEGIGIKPALAAAILRAGSGILDGFLQIVPSARVGHVGLYRDPKTLQAVEYYFKMPQSMEERDAIVLDPPKFAPTVAHAERAARAAMSDHLGKAAPAQSGIAELGTLLSGLQESHASTGRETQDAIGAVHQTLETIISRLSSLEAELVADRQAAASQPARTPMPPRIAAAERAAGKAPTMPPAAMPASMSVALEDRIAAPERAPQPKREAPAAPAAAAANTLSAALDVPLEPGSGRPRPDAPPAGGHDTQSIRQNLIAAARRSAKAATEAAAAAPATAPEAAKGGGRLKEIMEKRKRPLLLGLAALVLALGTAHLVTNALKGPRTAATGEAVQSPITPREDATPPAKDQSSALPPASTAAQPAALAAATPPAAEVTGSTTQPAAPEAKAPVSAEPVQAATNVGDLPPTLGTAGMRKAALDGDARAVYELASRAADGPAASRDPKLALRLFERAAVAGLAPLLRRRWWEGLPAEPGRRRPVSPSASPGGAPASPTARRPSARDAAPAAAAARWPGSSRPRRRRAGTSGPGRGDAAPAGRHGRASPPGRALAGRARRHARARRGRRDRSPLPEEQLDVADDLDAFGFRLLHRPVRNRMGQRHARRQDQAVEARPIGRCEVDDRDAPARRLLAARGIVVEGLDLRPAGDQRQRGGEARAAEPEQRNALAGKTGDGRHLSAASASTGRSAPAPRR